MSLTLKYCCSKAFSCHSTSCDMEKAEQPVRDLTRYVKYPRYIRVQRQKAMLQQRMKVPPTINFFYNPVNANLNAELLNLAKKYAVETKEVRKQRLAEAAEKKTDIKAPLCLTTGVNAVTNAIEHKKASLVLIANDVDPLEVCTNEDLRVC